MDTYENNNEQQWNEEAVLTEPILHHKAPSLSAYQTTPIEKFYDLNYQVLTAFQSSYEQKIYKIAYAYGLKFVETALLEIPKHGYFYSNRAQLAEKRMQSSLDAFRVAQILQDLQENPDQFHIETTFADHMQVSKLAELALAQVNEAQEQYEQRRVKTEAEIRAPEAYRRRQPNPHQHYSQQRNSWMHCAEPMLAGCSEGLSILCPSPSQSKRQSSATTTNFMREGQDHNYMPPLYNISASSTYDQHQANAMPPTVNAVTTKKSSSYDDNQNNSFLQSTPPETHQSAVLAVTTSRTKGSIHKVDHNHDSWSFAHAQPPPLTRFVDEEKFSSGPFSYEDDSTAAAIPITSSLLRSQSYIVDDTLLEKALFLSGMDVASAAGGARLQESFGMLASSSMSSAVTENAVATQILDENKFGKSSSDDNERVPPPTLSVRHSVQSGLQFNLISSCYHEDFDHLRNTGRIRVTFADTFQGRIPESTNGCTVIAPLLCIHHLLDDRVPDPGLPDSTITSVIDVETPVILRQLRHELGLSAQAFLIPSDAHDHLIENGQLSQKQFINVTGGNVLDEGHLAAFVNAIVSAKNRRVAATFFFHEHVVAILKLQQDVNTFWYDLIDGLPLKATLLRMGESNDWSTMSLSSKPLGEAMSSASSEAFLTRTARIRCLNSEALTVCLRWYACSKFGEDNISFIDRYPWNDNSCDFDPRVFQGFVWGSDD